MAQTQTKQESENKKRIDKVGESGIYPVSEMEGASDDAVVQSEASLGQGARGAAGYSDSGTSEIIPDERFTNAEGEKQSDDKR